MTLIIILKDDTILKFTNVIEVTPIYKDEALFGLTVIKLFVKFEFASADIQTFKCVHDE
jgi:hypothetical protein